MSVADHPEQPHLRLYRVGDARLFEPRPHLDASEFAMDDVNDDDWDTFYAALAER